MAQLNSFLQLAQLAPFRCFGLKCSPSSKTNLPFNCSSLRTNMVFPPLFFVIVQLAFWF